MASRWRRRPVCRLADGGGEAALKALSGRGAFLLTGLRPTIGASVTLEHPEAGAITGRVVGIQEDGIALRFQPGPASVAWALAAIAADMSRPA